jgi:hypothetical protein
MNKMRLTKLAIASSTVACAALLSFGCPTNALQFGPQAGTLEE